MCGYSCARDKISLSPISCHGTRWNYATSTSLKYLSGTGRLSKKKKAGCTKRLHTAGHVGSKIRGQCRILPMADPCWHSSLRIFFFLLGQFMLPPRNILILGAVFTPNKSPWTWRGKNIGESRFSRFSRYHQFIFIPLLAAIGMSYLKRGFQIFWNQKDNQVAPIPHTSPTTINC